MSKVIWMHEKCAIECNCVTDADVAIIAPDDMECDETWCHICEACGEPSVQAQAYAAQEEAYWHWYFSGGMREFKKQESALREASDGELAELSHDCGKRISRG